MAAAVPQCQGVPAAASVLKQRPGSMREAGRAAWRVWCRAFSGFGCLADSLRQGTSAVSGGVAQLRRLPGVPRSASWTWVGAGRGSCGEMQRR